MQRVLIAIGGNSLTQENQEGTIIEQFTNARQTSYHVAQAIQAGWNIILTHGNGPQVGAKLRRVELSEHQVYPLPLGILDADTQGGIGYMLQQVLGNQLRIQGIHKTIVSLVTQVEVEQTDPELIHPSKPIGPFYDQESAAKQVTLHGWTMAQDSGRGWRRLVPSPKPVSIIELDAILQCLNSNKIIPIACGGGGVPVVRNGDLLEGIDGVIDKDRTSSLLATQVKADVMVISTNVEKVCVGFNTPHEQKLSRVNVTQLQNHYANGEFAPGSMGPKIEAIVNFLQNGGKRGIITDPVHLFEALNGNAGTQITL